MAQRKQKNPTENNIPAAPDERVAPDERLEMRIPARAEWVRVVRLATAGVASRMGFSYDDVEDIKLAVAEACNNAILHSAPDGSTPVVTIGWQVLPDAIRISVSDEGRLNPPGLPRRAGSTPRRQSPEDLPESGMGLILIEGLMDEVEHESGPNVDTAIHMTKRMALSPTKTPSPAKASRAASRPNPDAPVSLRPSRKSLGKAGVSHSRR